MADDEAHRLARRAIAYISCAIYDVARIAGLSCQPSAIPNGRRPAWIIGGEPMPVSLTLSDIEISDRTCQMTIAAVTMLLDAPKTSEARWVALLNGFKAKFGEISV